MTFGSLFTGIGGIDLGLERAGWKCAFQVELDPFCNTVLEKHWPGVKRYGDIRTIRGDELEPVDLLAGGYPCQPFSQAGKRGGESDPRHLWPEFARLIRVLRPRFVLLENVPGHLSLGFGAVLGDLARLGYDAEWLCLRAADFGASHLRKRVFVVAYRTGSRCAGSEDARASRGDAGEGARSLEPQRIGSTLADSTERGFRIIRESSGRVGLAHGGFPELVNATDDHGRRGISGAQEGVGPGEFGRRGSTGTGGHVANPARDVWDGSHGEDGARRGVCEAGEPMADTRNGQLQEQGRGPGGRDGIGSAGEVLSDTPEPGLEKRGRERSDCEQERAAIERDCGKVEHSARTQSERFEQQREHLFGRAGCFAPGPSDPRWSSIVSARPDLAPSISTYPSARNIARACAKERSQCFPRRGRRQLRKQLALEIQLALTQGIAWEKQAIATLRGMAHGRADGAHRDERLALISAQEWLGGLSNIDARDRAMSERTKRLRALGNAVVPQVAEYIGRVLKESLR